jgi:anti-sigma factor RsiW
MTKPNPLNEQEREDIVAFLDGELRGEAARALGAKINLDPGVRAEAESLKRTWGLLDYLPKPEPSPNFTHRTLEKMAPIPTATRTPAKRLSLRPWWIGAGWAAALVMAASAGYIGVGLTRPKPDTTDRDLARDLRVIENMRFYEHVDDLDFLKSLDKPDLFGEDASVSER